MDSSWQQQPFPDSSGPSRRHNGAVHLPREYTSQPPPPPAPAAYGSDHGQYQSAATGHGPLHQSSQQAANPSASPSMASMPPVRDGSGDIPMHDALDTHASIRYPMRPHHQPRSSTGGPASSYLSQEQPSSAAQRYSPMDTRPLNSPYASKSGQFAPLPTQTQSPGGQTSFPQSPYFSARQGDHQLPPITPFGPSQESGYPSAAVANLDGSFVPEPKPTPRSNPPASKPVPEFRKLRTMSDLQPKKSRQPPFRRANPEGGFISVCRCSSHRSIALPNRCF